MRSLAVIPALDEAETIEAVVRGAAAHVDAVCVIDDGSSDATAELARRAGARVLSQARGGKGAALRAGFAEAAGFDAVVTLDADGEHDPADIPRLLAALEAGADLAVGERAEWRTPTRRALNAFALFWFRLVAPEVRDTICGFRAVRTSALARLDLAGGGPGFELEHAMLLEAVRHGCRLASVPITLHTRPRTRVGPLDLVRANNQFDRWVLRHHGALRLSPGRRALLVAGALVGLVGGTPLEATLRWMKPSFSR